MADMADRMSLKVLLPFAAFLSKDGISEISADTSCGSLGLLPHRLDCVAVLRPGILSYRTDGEGESFIAVDEGVLVKAGPLVTVSARRAMGGVPLGRLKEAVLQEFLVEAEADRTLREVMTRIETGLMIRLRQLQDE